MCCVSTDTDRTAAAEQDPFIALDLLGQAVDALVERAGAEKWNAATPAAGWDVATQIAHLHWTDAVSLQAIEDVDAFNGIVEQAMADPTGFVDKGALELAQQPRAELLAAWRRDRDRLARVLAETDPGQQLPWFGPPMRPKSMARARIMETWAHGTDIADTLGAQLDCQAALPHVARIGFATRDFAYLMNQLDPPADPFHVVLTGPNGTVEFGPEDAPQRVTGSLEDFCLLVTQRVHRADTDLVAEGEDAEHWLGIAQAFAGLPGGGREKGARA